MIIRNGDKFLKIQPLSAPETTLGYRITKSINKDEWKLSITIFCCRPNVHETNADKKPLRAMLSHKCSYMSNWAEKSDTVSSGTCAIKQRKIKIGV